MCTDNMLLSVSHPNNLFFIEFHIVNDAAR